MLTILTNSSTQFDYDSLLAFLRTNFTIVIDESGEDPIITGNVYTLGVKGEYLDNNVEKEVNCVFAIVDPHEEYLITFSKLNAYDRLSSTNRIDFYKDDYPTIKDNVIQVF